MNIIYTYKHIYIHLQIHVCTYMYVSRTCTLQNSFGLAAQQPALEVQGSSCLAQAVGGSLPISVLYEMKTEIRYYCSCEQLTPSSILIYIHLIE